MFNKTFNIFKSIFNQKKQTLKLFIYKHFYLKKQVQKNIILFESMLGRNYSGNPKYIYEEMVKQGLDKKYNCIWIFVNPNTKIKGDAKIVKRSTLKYMYYLSISKIWVFDCRQPNFIVKKDEITYIQTWHGTPLKKLALDMNTITIADNLGIENYKANFWKNTRRWDYLIAQNDFSANIFKNCFDFRKEILTIGYPRNDILVHNNNEEYINSLKDKFNLPKDRKIILYSPTWRDDEYYLKGNYKFNPHLNFDHLKYALQDEYIFIIKYHYLVSCQMDFSRFSNFIFDINTDIQELYLISDILMTDYSSVMFDFSILNRPMIFYTYDLSKYANDIRGFYFDLSEEAPGPLVFNTDELINVLKAHDFSRYQDKYNAFRNKFNSNDDGYSCEKVVAIIKDKLSSE